MADDSDVDVPEEPSAELFSMYRSYTFGLGAGNKPLSLMCSQFGDVDYIAVHKTDRKIQRLLLQHCKAVDAMASISTDSTRPLSRTDIIEQLESLRNKAFSDAFQAAHRKEYDPAKKGHRLLGKGLGDVAEILAPTIGDVTGIVMRVLMRPPGSPLLVQAKIEYFIYLAKVVAQQIQQGTIKREKPVVPVDVDAESTKQESDAPSRVHASNAASKPNHIRARHVVKKGVFRYRYNLGSTSKSLARKQLLRWRKAL